LGKSPSISLPADIRKEGSGWPWESSAIPRPEQEGRARLFVGDLSPDGGLRGVRGRVPIAIEARGSEISKIVVPKLNAHELRWSLELRSIRYVPCLMWPTF
jgi:magnesium chelatase family protein